MPSNADIYASLRDRVVNGEFEPQERLKPEILRQDYGCSASTIRESLFRLSTLGLVDFQEQRGFRIPQRSSEVQHDLTLCRILLECEGACLSIRSGGVAWEARLTAAHHALSYIESRVRDGENKPEVMTLWSNAELDFHRTLIDACGSKNLKDMHFRIYHQFRQQMITADREFVFVPENIAQHKGILDAALAHDETLVRDRIHDHLSRNLIRDLPRPVLKIA